jgi:hypothetical protein
MASATAKPSTPIRPIAISAAMTSLPASVSSPVAPSDSPTVPSADSALNSSRSKAMRSDSVKRNSAAASTSTETVRTLAAWRTLSSRTGWPNSSTGPPRALARTSASSTATVVTLSPPPVPDGEAPISIST